MIKLSLNKNSKVGKTLAIFSLTRNLPVKSKNSVDFLVTYSILKYFKEIVGYDKVYLLNFYNNDSLYLKRKAEFNESIKTPGITLLNLKDNIEDKIDDFLHKPDGINLFGGFMHTNFFYIVNLIYSKINKGNSFDFYRYDDDPRFIIFNEVKHFNKKFINDKIKYNVDNNIIEQYKNNVDKVIDFITENVIGVYNGLDYEQYCNNHKICKRSDLHLIKRWVYCEINEYTFSNSQSFNIFMNFTKFEDKKYDFVYFGANRACKERNKVLNSFFNTLDSTKNLAIGGFINSIDNKHYFECLDTMSPENLYDKLNDCKISFYIQDKINWDNFKSFRFYESLLSGAVMLFYKQNDKNNVYINNPELRNYIYINTPEEFKDKVELYSKDKNLYYKIIYLQYKEVFEQLEKYLSKDNKEKLSNIIKTVKEYVKD